MKKKVLILGTNAGQSDIIKYLNKEGWETHACGYKRIGSGCDLANYFHLVDISNTKLVKELALDIKADLVYSVSSDLAITTATKVSEELNLPRLLNSELIDLFNNKDDFRAFLNKKNIGFVNYIKINNTSSEHAKWDIFPCVVKPVDSQGQRGVFFVNEEKDLAESVKQASVYSKSGKVIIEEYLNGEEFSTNVIVQNGEILVNEFSDRLIFDKSYFGLPRGHAIPPLYINEKQFLIAEQYVHKIVKELQIKDAVLYIQMKLSNNEPKIIEIAPRLDGCHIWRLIKSHRGIDIRGMAIKLCMKEKIEVSYNDEKKDIQSILEFFHLPTDEVFNKSKLPVKDNTIFNEFRYKDGDEITPINGKLEVVGYHIFEKSL